MGVICQKLLEVADEIDEELSKPEKENNKTSVKNEEVELLKKQVEELKKELHQNKNPNANVAGFQQMNNQGTNSMNYQANGGYVQYGQVGTFQSNANIGNVQPSVGYNYAQNSYSNNNQNNPNPQRVNPNVNASNNNSFKIDEAKSTSRNEQPGNSAGTSPKKKAVLLPNHNYKPPKGKAKESNFNTSVSGVGYNKHVNKHTQPKTNPVLNNSNPSTKKPVAFIFPNDNFNGGKKKPNHETEKKKTFSNLEKELGGDSIPMDEINAIVPGLNERRTSLQTTYTIGEQLSDLEVSKSTGRSTSNYVVPPKKKMEHNGFFETYEGKNIIEEDVEYRKIIQLLNSDQGLVPDTGIQDQRQYSRGIRLPIYRSKNWLGEMGDRYLSNTEYDSTEGCLQMFQSSHGLWLMCFKRIMKEHPSWINTVDLGSKKLKRFVSIMEEHENLKKNPFYGQMGTSEGMYNFLTKYWMPKLKGMKNEDILHWQGGWSAKPGHAVTYTIKRNQNDFSFIVSNSGGGLGFHSSSSKDYPVGKAGTDARIDGISPKKIFRAAFWFLIFKIGSQTSDNHSSFSLYDVILPYLCENSFSDELYKTRNDKNALFQLPQQSGTCFYKSIQFGNRYVMRMVGFTEDEASQVLFAIKRQFLEYASEDLLIQPALTHSEIELIRIGIKQVAIYAKIEYDAKRLSLSELKQIKSTFEKIEKTFKSKNKIELSIPAFQPKLKKNTNSMEFKMFEKFDLFVGQKSEETKNLVDKQEEIKFSGLFDLFEKKIITFADMIEKITKAEEYYKTAMKISNMTKYFFAMSIIERLILTFPLPNPNEKNLCFYEKTSITSEEQKNVLERFEQLYKYYLDSTKSVPRTNDIVVNRSLIMGAVLVICDSIIRKQPSDKKSIVAECLREYYTSFFSPGRISFIEYTSLMVLKDKRYARVMSKVNEYFDYQYNTHKKEIMRAYQSHWYLYECNEFLMSKEILKKKGIRMEVKKNDHTKKMETDEVQTIARYYFSRLVDPLLAILRDLQFSFLWTMQESPKAGENFDGKTYEGYGSRMFFWCGDIKDTTSPHTAKIYMSYGNFGAYKSMTAIPKLSTLNNPERLVMEKKNDKVTENDVLYNRKLPNFNEIFTQEDSEHLISLMTTPYICLPLILMFLTSNGRTSLILNREIQIFLRDLILQPGNFRSLYNGNEIKMIPTKSKIGTNLGILSNEILRAPHAIMKEWLKIMNFAFCELSTEQYKPAISNCVLYVIRMSSYIESYILDAIERKERNDGYLQKIHEKMRFYMDKNALGILQNWINQFSTDVMMCSKLHIHIALMYRNCNKFSKQYTINFMSSLMYVNIFYGFAMEIDETEVPVFRDEKSLNKKEKEIDISIKNKKKEEKKEEEGKKSFLLIDDTEYFSMLMKTNKSVVDYLKTAGNEKNEILRKILENLHFKNLNEYEFTPSEDNVSYVCEKKKMEINLQMAKIFFHDQIIKPVDDKILKHYDFQVVFGKKPRHCAILSESDQKVHMNLVGTKEKTEITFFKKPGVSKFKIRPEKVIENDDSENEKTKYTLLQECLGKYKRIDEGNKGKTIYATLKDRKAGSNINEVNYSSDDWWRLTLEDHPSEKDVLQVVGPQNHAGKNWRVYVMRDEDGCVEKIRFFQHVLKIVESQSVVPSKKFNKFYTERSQFTRAYDAKKLKNNEKWIANALEPVLSEEFGSDKKEFENSKYSLYLPGEISDDADRVRILMRKKNGKSHDESKFSGTTWKELFIYKKSNIVEAYKVEEYCRKVYRKLIYSSNTHYCFGNLRVSTMNREFCWFDGYQNAGGNFKTEYTPSNTLQITRWDSKGKRFDYLPYDYLIGLIPFPLCRNFIFWQNPESGTIYGYPRDFIKVDEEFMYNILIELTPNGQGRIFKLSDDFTQKKQELVNCNVLNDLMESLTRLENCSHILVWANLEDVKEIDKKVKVERIEMPRLGQVWSFKENSKGEVQLYNLNNSGLFVSNERNERLEKIMKDFPNAILLENEKKEYFVLSNSCPLFSPQISYEPLHNNIVSLRGNNDWIKQKIRTFLYPIHVSELFIIPKTRISSLYYVLIQILRRKYKTAFDLLEGISIDTICNDSELFYLKIFDVLKDSDSMPDSFGCKLRLYLTLYYLDDDLKKKINLPFDSSLIGNYFSRRLEISDDCKLTIDEICLIDSTNSYMLKLRDILEKKPNAETTHKLTVYSPSRHSKTSWETIEDQSFSFFNNESCRKWETEFVYDPKIKKKKLVGPEAIEMFKSLWEDYMSGCVEKMGFLYIFELLLGRKTMSIDGTQDDTFLLGKTLAHELYLLATNQNVLPLDMSSTSTDKSYTPLSILASLTYRRKSLYKTIRENDCLIKNSSYDFFKGYVGYYQQTTRPQDGFVFTSSGSLFFNNGNHWKLKKDENDSNRFRIEEPNHGWVMGIQRENGTISLNFYSSTYKRIDLGVDLPKNRFAFPQIPFNNPHLKDLWTKKGNEGVSIANKDSNVRNVIRLFVNRLIDTAQNVFLQVKAEKRKWRMTESIIEKKEENIPMPKNKPLYLQDRDKFRDNTQNEMMIKTNSSESLKYLMVYPMKEVIGFNDFIEANEIDSSKKTTEDLGFDLYFHKTIKESYVGKKLVERLKKEKKNYFEILKKEIDLVFKNTIGINEKTIPSLEKLMEIVTKWREQESMKIFKLVNQLVEKANEFDLNEKPERYMHSIYQISEGDECKINFNDLIRLTMNKNFLDLFKIKNPFKNDSRVKELLDEVPLLMMRINRLGIVGRVCEKIKVLEKTIRGGNHKLIMNESRDLCKLICTKRFFFQNNNEEVVRFDPRFLYFEYANNIVLREMQVNIILEFIKGNRNDLIRQMIMGAGKTTVVAPLLSLILATQNKLVHHTVPGPLVQFTVDVLSSKFSFLEMKKIQIFKFDRNYEIDQIIKLKKKIVLAQKNKDVLISSPEAIKSMFLKYIELLNSGKKDDTRVSVLKEILKIWRGDTVLIMDEVDILLNPLKSELNFPIGEKKSLDSLPERFIVPLMLFDAFNYFSSGEVSFKMLRKSSQAMEMVKELKTAIENGVKVQAFQTIPHLILLSKTFYFDKIKPILVKLMLVWLQQKHVFAEISKNDCYHYLSRSASSSPDVLNQFGNKFSDSSKSHVKLLNMIFDFVNVFIPHCMTKINRVSYGLMTQEQIEDCPPQMPISRTLTSIPFVGKDCPSESSEFAHPDILISLSILGYLFEGLRKTDTLSIVLMLKRDLLKQQGPVENRPAYVNFKKWIKYSWKKQKSNVKINPLNIVQITDQDQMNKIHQLLKNNAGTIYYYLENKIFPEFLVHHLEKISASGQELASLFDKKIGFSGTPNDLIPLSLGAPMFEPGSDGKIVQVLTNNDVVSHTVLEQNWSVLSILDHICKSKRRYNALIDVGCYVTGLSNLEVAVYLCKNLPAEHYDGVAYLDDSDNQMIILKSDMTPMKLADCGVNKSRRFTFYDQVHTTGIDVKQAIDAHACLTIGKDVTLRDCAQGAWRMRGLGVGQTLDYLIVPEIEMLIKNELLGSFETDEKRMVFNVMKFLCINYVKQGIMQFNQLQMQNANDVVRKVGLKYLLMDNTSLSMQWFKRCFEVFKEQINFNILEEVPKPVSFKQKMKELVSNFTDFFTKQPECKNTIDRIIELSSNVKTGNNENSFDSEQEKESEVEIQQEKESEQEEQQKVHYLREDQEIIPWKTDQLKQFNVNKHAFYRAKFFDPGVKIDSMPEYLLVSENYFKKVHEQKGFRRLKNIYMMVEWIISKPNGSMRGVTKKSNNSKNSEEIIRKVFDLFDVDGDRSIDKEELNNIMIQIGKKNKNNQNNGVINFTKFKNLVQTGFDTGKYSYYENHFFVIMCLSELESLRFLLDENGSIFTNNEIGVCIRLLNGNILAKSQKFDNLVQKLDKTVQVNVKNASFDIASFLDCKFHFNNSSLCSLLVELGGTSKIKKKELFDLLLKCKRREKQNYKKTKVNRLFLMNRLEEWMIKLAIKFRILYSLDKKGEKVVDRFRKMDEDSNGYLDPNELYEGLKNLDINRATLEKLVETVDKNEDGLVDLEEFTSFLSGEVEDDEEDNESKDSLSVEKLANVVNKKKNKGIKRIEIDGGSADINSKKDEKKSEKTEEDVKIDQLLKKMFTTCSPQDGYAFPDHPKVKSMTDYNDAYRIVATNYSRDWKKCILASEKTLTKVAKDTSHYKHSIFPMFYGLWQTLPKRTDIGRKIVFMSAVRDENYDHIRKSGGWLIDWAFKPWNLGQKDVNDIYDKLKLLDKSDRFEDEVTNLVVKKLNEDYNKNLI